jgi:hypothetical protein
MQGNKMGNPRICKRCVLPESKPQIWLDNEGVCNLCLEHEQAKKDQAVRPLLETDFIKLLDRHKGKGRYDCLVMCSGGKDSTSALYYMKKRYHLNPLAFSFDHGFETEEALSNVRAAVDILGVDYLLYKSDYMREMFSLLLSSGSRAVLCHPCSIWYMGVAFEMAERFDIPIIIAGWTKGQSTRQEVMSKCGCNINSPEFARMAAETKAFLDQVRTNPKYKDFPKSMEEVLERSNKRHRAIVLSPHWFLPFDTGHNLRLIKKELGWKATTTSYPKGTTNCLLNFISVHNSMRHYGYTHYHVEMSKLIRENQLTREEALKEDWIMNLIDNHIFGYLRL